LNFLKLHFVGFISDSLTDADAYVPRFKAYKKFGDAKMRRIAEWGPCKRKILFDFCQLSYIATGCSFLMMIELKTFLLLTKYKINAMNNGRSYGVCLRRIIPMDTIVNFIFTSKRFVLISNASFEITRKVKENKLIKWL
jgi:hypothetical protein